MLTPKLPVMFVVAACVVSLSITAAHAATSRSNWVTSQIYNNNHPYAPTDSANLATKMSTMSMNAFNFYRGTDHIFYQDMLTLPSSNYETSQTGYTWLGGDTHIGNFGGLKDSNGNAIFSVNDFDEAYLGQYVWDLRRLATSIVLAGRANGVSDSNITTAIHTMVGAYVDQMGAFKGSSAELSFQLTKSNTTGVVDDTITAVGNDSRSSLLSKYTQLSGSTRTFQNIANSLISVNSATYNNISGAMSSYISSIAVGKRYALSYYTVKDIHQKMGSGVGSLGKLRYYALIEGPSSATSDDVILELKQASMSAVSIADYGRLPSSVYNNNEANRVVLSAKAQQLNTDVLIGYAPINGLNFYVHEKSPYAEDFDYTLLNSSSKLSTAATYLGQALASAHAVSDQDYNSSIVSYSIDKQVSDAVTSKSGLQSEIATFAFNYVAQVTLDWQSFVTAYNNGTPLY